MRNYLFYIVFLSSALSGCSVGPEYVRPNAELPDAWKVAPAAGKAVVTERWWTVYGDPMLDRLIDEALVNNQDLALATARLDEARALARVADSRLAPAIDGQLQRDRSHRSDSTATRIPGSLENNNYRAQLNVSYELDLWGRLRSTAKAAQAELLANAAARETVRLALTAQVAQSYYALVALDAQLSDTRKSLALREDNLRLQRIRSGAGLISDFELRQLEAEVAAAQAQLPALERRRSSEELALGVLLGRSPRALISDSVARSTDSGLPATPVVPADLPSDLLLRRPDVVAAEQQLIAANARISAARAALFPRIGLSGYLGSESAALSSLFSGPAQIWSLGFALAQPIFQGGRLFGEMEAVQARERQTLAQYQKTLQTAFRETHDALVAQTRAREAFDAENARARALSDSLRLARIRYENGLTSQLEALDAERNLLSAELNRSDALRAQRAAVADVVRALGGGWTGLAKVDATGQRQPRGSVIQ
ncbi:MAG: efflux transporter outer membrane subunit [Burkholderiales bacterium]|nr:efflux transporter outer membrane subunit [Burkholderiales bacterium]